MSSQAEHDVAAGIPALWDRLDGEVAAGRRLADLFGTATSGGLLLSAQLAGTGGISTLDALVPPGGASYPALTPRIGAAFWYEREIHDLFGIVPEGHPRLEPLILPTSASRRPEPGTAGAPAAIEPDPGILPRHTTGPGLFTIPHGPVRSGVVESLEYLVETPGEDMPGRARCGHVPRVPARGDRRRRLLRPADDHRGYRRRRRRRDGDQRVQLP
jgi:formate hydrogenlyase subunit 5